MTVFRCFSFWFSICFVTVFGVIVWFGICRRPFVVWMRICGGQSVGRKECEVQTSFCFVFFPGVCDVVLI